MPTSSCQLGGSRLLVVAAVTLASCDREPAPPPSPPPPVETTPPDTLAPGELGEGPYQAFGLPLPLGMRVERTSTDYVEARGRLKLEEVTSYVRARIEADRVATGPAKTIFEDAKVTKPRATASHGDAGPADVVVRYEVAFSDGVTTLTGRREIRKRMQEGLSEDQRWERLGHRKDGRPIDPRDFK